jgi:hypothetical protein
VFLLTGYTAQLVKVFSVLLMFDLIILLLLRGAACGSRVVVTELSIDFHVWLLMLHDA